MSLYANYIQERTDKLILEDERGFAVYSWQAGAVYLEDIYVLPDYRKTGVAAEFADKICQLALEKGIHKLLGSCVPTAKGSTESMKVLIAYGMKLDSCAVNFILFSKEI